jgi:hypothetical protein
VAIKTDDGNAIAMKKLVTMKKTEDGKLIDIKKVVAVNTDEGKEVAVKK